MLSRSEAGKLGAAKSAAKSKERYEAFRAEYLANPKICGQCHVALPYAKRHNQYCNHTCAAQHSNPIRTTTRSGRSACDSCAGPVLKGRKYCAVCWGNVSDRRKILVLDETKTDRIRRRILTKTRGHRCEVCHLADWQGLPIALDLDHIDGNADNNSEGNLRLICPNCHAQTPTYKGRNKGTESTRSLLRKARYQKNLKPPKGVWPSEGELSKMVWERTATELAKEVGVCYNSFRKHCSRLGIAMPPKGHWQRSRGAEA